ncbi:MAG TPA: hypothetical protein DDY91_08755 [Planctomycetaceae bacterium]|nr:hypothetical protein [Planctomycetaceae bacterium]
MHSIRLAGPWYFSQSAECPPRPPDVARNDRNDLPFLLPAETPARLQRFFQRPIRLDPRESVRVRIVASRPLHALYFDQQPLDHQPLESARQPGGLCALLPTPLTGRHCLTLDFAPTAPAANQIAGEPPEGELPAGELQEVWLEFLGTEPTVT